MSNGRAMVIGHPLTGEYHLLLRYTRFPQDVGTWTCTSYTPGDVVQSSNLTLLVAPAVKVNVSIEYMLDTFFHNFLI